MDKKLKENKASLRCLVPGCKSNLRTETVISIRVLVCKKHRRAEVIESPTKIYRYCQQCTKIHELSEFEASRRSCRAALDRHNMLRRRKASIHSCESSGSASRLTSSSPSLQQETGITAQADDSRTTAYASAASDMRLLPDTFSSQAAVSSEYDAQEVSRSAFASNVTITQFQGSTNNNLPSRDMTAEVSRRASRQSNSSGPSSGEECLPSDIESELRRIDEWIAHTTCGPTFADARMRASAGVFTQFAGQGHQQSQNVSRYQEWQHFFGSSEHHVPQPRRHSNPVYPGDQQAAISSVGWQNMRGEQHMEAYHSESPSNNNFSQQRFDYNQQSSPQRHEQQQQSWQDGNSWEENGHHAWQGNQFDYNNPLWPSTSPQH